jgi:2-phospho-L-lactate guanylyltransferase
MALPAVDVIATVVPVKPSREAKSRLAPVLSASERATLTRDLLVRTVQVARTLGPVVVVSRSPRMRNLATRHGATALSEDGHDLNEAVGQGLAWAATRAEAALVLPADLPMVTARDLEELAAVPSPPSGGEVVVPCQRGEGTNALLLRPPGAIAPRFGRASLARHVAAADAAGLACTVHHAAGMVDLDVPDDWLRHGTTIAPG